MTLEYPNATRKKNCGKQSRHLVKTSVRGRFSRSRNIQISLHVHRNAREIVWRFGAFLKWMALSSRPLSIRRRDTREKESWKCIDGCGRKGGARAHGETKGSTGRNPDSAKADRVTGDEGKVRWNCAYVYVKPYLRGRVRARRGCYLNALEGGEFLKRGGSLAKVTAHARTKRAGVTTIAEGTRCVIQFAFVCGEFAFFGVQLFFLFFSLSDTTLVPRHISRKPSWTAPVILLFPWLCADANVERLVKRPRRNLGEHNGTVRDNRRFTRAYAEWKCPCSPLN